jgi:SAM-dependent methyltransferase
MIMPAADPAPPCKVCQSPTRLLGFLDANRCCVDRLGKRFLPVSSEAVPYYGCSRCSFIFTTYMDGWSAEDFKTKIYNAEYERLNPAIPGRDHVPLKETPSYLAGKRIASLFQGSQQRIRVLDYGAGGNPGPTGLGLIDAGFSVQSYEPYRSDGQPPSGKFDVIVCIEVMEHCHDLGHVAAAMAQYLSDDGIILIQTLLHPHPIPDNILTSWYIAPRDGHVSIFTLPALTLLFRRVGINVVHTIDGNFAFRRLPTFPNQIFLPN